MPDPHDMSKFYYPYRDPNTKVSYSFLSELLLIIGDIEPSQDTEPSQSGSSIGVIVAVIVAIVVVVVAATVVVVGFIRFRRRRLVRTHEELNHFFLNNDEI